MGEFVRLEVDEASRVGTIRLDRPPVNALNAQVQRELGEAAREAGLDDRVGAVVIWGGEKVFTAGADIKEMEGRTFAEILVDVVAAEVIEPWGGGKWHLDIFRSTSLEPEDWNGEM